MDGVLADFAGAAARLCGRSPDDLPKGSGYDIAKTLRVSQSELDRRIQFAPRFWSTLDVLPDAGRIFDFIKKQGPMYILSTPWLDSPSSFAEKVEWCRSKFNIPSDRVILTHDKYLLAGRRRILIDDHTDNCEAWMKAGGIAIQMPAHHNEIDANPYQHLTTVCAQLRQVAKEHPNLVR